MKALIPAAGVGTRLRPITNTTPKALLQVGDKPIIGHIIDKLVALGINDIVIIVGYLGDVIKEYCVQEYGGLNIDYVYQRELLGLGHAVWLSADKISDNDELFIIYGDTIVEGDIKAAFSYPGDGALGVNRVEDPKRFGVVELDGDRIVHAVEKPETFLSNLALIGANYFRKPRLLFDALNYLVEHDIRTRGEIQITDAFQVMIERGAELHAFMVDSWFDCGKAETLLSTNRHILEGLKSAPHGENCVFIDPVYVAPDAKVANSVVGPNVTIASGAQVNRCIVVDTIVNQDAVIEGYSLRDSIIGFSAAIRQNARSLILGDYATIESIV